ncbi:MAG: gliding motility-associated C-terminal domain-containing protein [Flavobacteriales bacterium]|nr:gliding motility-associated C-terminal domain-containing protein [Flavobacteriales bacterium]
MKRELTGVLRDRFRAHEAPVDPGTWEAIRTAMAAPVAAQDPLNELFRERFEEHGTDVDPGLWDRIGSQLGHAAPAAPAAGGATIGWAAASVVALVVAGTVFLTTRPDSAPDQGPVASVQAPSTTVEPVTIPAPVREAGPSAEPTIAEAGPVVGSRIPEQESASMSSTPVTPIDGPDRVEDEAVPALMEAAEPTVTASGPAPGIPVVEDGKALVEQILEEMTTEAERAAKGTEASERTPPPSQARSSTDGLRADPEENISPAPLPKLFLPNTFTPNGDGVNDEYEVGAEDFEQVMLRVFSVKGDQLVFSTNTGEKWTGANCEDGYYLVAVEALTHDGRTVTEGKVVWLARTR